MREPGTPWGRAQGSSGGAHYRGGGGGPEAPGAPVAERGETRDAAQDPGGRAVGRDDYDGERWAGDRAGAGGGREEWGLPAEIGGWTRGLPAPGPGQRPGYLSRRGHRARDRDPGDPHRPGGRARARARQRRGPTGPARPDPPADPGHPGSLALRAERSQPLADLPPGEGVRSPRVLGRRLRGADRQRGELALDRISERSRPDRRDHAAVAPLGRGS